MERKITLTDLSILVLGVFLFIATQSWAAGILMTCLGLMVRRFLLPHGTPSKTL